MQISKISPAFFSNYKIPEKKQNYNQNNNQSLKTLSINPLNFGYNDYLLAFGARVDKGLARFYEENQERMPVTVKNYIESLPTKRGISPLEAQNNAYSKLSSAVTIEDIQRYYPDEDLFEDLKSSDDNKAKRGLLYDIKVMKEDLKESDEGILKNKEDLTVYLVKKLFLESKTLKELNESLDEDLNPIFQKQDKNYITYSTLDTLGIKLPSVEYLTSLRFTREGYSDEIGDKISESQQRYYENLSPEERLQRNQKSLNNLEKWWSELSDEDKKSMLTTQDKELALLKAYKNRETSSKSKKSDISESDNRKKTSTKPHQPKEKIETKLNEDPLYSEWARKNLELFEAGLSEKERREISEQRSKNMIERWSSMNPAQKTDYIEKMQAGSEKQKYVMIDAWNNCEDIREHMSDFMKEHNLYRPENLIYRSQEYTEAQKNMMIQFWATYPSDAQELGEEIKKSWKKVNNAIALNSFDNLKEEITITQTIIKKNMRNNSTQKSSSIKQRQLDRQMMFREIETHPRSAMKEFMRTYKHKNSFLPNDFLRSYFETANQLSDKDLSIWTKLLKGEYVEPFERKSFGNKMSNIKDTMTTEKRAIEQSLAEVLYKASGDPILFSLKFNDLSCLSRVIINNPVKKNQDGVFSLNSHEKNETLNIKFKRQPDFSEVNNLYKKYNEKLSEKEIDDIVKTNFFIGEEDKEKLYAPLYDFLKDYGKAALFIFDSTGFSDTVMSAFDKFQKLIPTELTQEGFDYAAIKSSLPNLLYNMYDETYPFIPDDFKKAYINDIASDNTSLAFRSLIENLDIKNSNTPSEPPQKLSTDMARKRIAMEQAVASAIYKETSNMQVFGLEYEELVFIANKVLNRPDDAFPYKMSINSKMVFNQKDFTLDFKHKISTKNLEEKYQAYQKQISDNPIKDMEKIMKLNTGNEEKKQFWMNFFLEMPEKQKGLYDSFSKFEYKQLGCAIIDYFILTALEDKTVDINDPFFEKLMFYKAKTQLYK